MLSENDVLEAEENDWGIKLLWRMDWLEHKALYTSIELKWTALTMIISAYALSGHEPITLQFFPSCVGAPKKRFEPTESRVGLCGLLSMNWTDFLWFPYFWRVHRGKCD